MSLQFYAYPHLMGEEVDYEIDDEDDDTAGAREEKDEDVEMGDEEEEEVEKELPRRMEALEIIDEDGDVEMADY